MAASIALKARVKETTTTTGTGTLNLEGAVSGFRTFVSAFGSGALVYYVLIQGTAWEVGLGTITSGAPDTLARTKVYDSSAGGAALTLAAGTTTVLCDSPFQDIDKRIYLPVLPYHQVMGFLTVTNTGYFVYLGKTKAPITAAFLELNMTVIGAGAQTAEVGLFSTPLAPNKAGQTLTKLVATGTVDSLTATLTIKRNTASFATDILAGTHLWAGIRTAMATTQPTFAAVAYDFLQGNVLTAAAPGALTGLSTVAGSVPALSSSPLAPFMSVTLD